MSGIRVLNNYKYPDIGLGFVYLHNYKYPGIGLGFVYISSILAVGFYFDKRRALANGIAASGSGFGLFLYAPLCIYLQVSVRRTWIYYVYYTCMYVGVSMRMYVCM